MHDVAAILLAAGLSRRMGAANKLLLPVNDTPAAYAELRQEEEQLT